MIRNAIVASLLLAAAPVAAADFAVMPGVSNASFTSEALLETINGTTSQLGGTISVDVASPTGATGTIAFPNDSLRTGIDLRDEHLYSDQWLGAGEVSFAITSVQTDAAALTHGQTIDATVTGQLTIKGTSQTVAAPARVTYYEVSSDQVAGTYGVENNLLRVTTAFDIELDDYGISIIAPLQNKVSNTIRLEVRVTAQQQ